MKFENRLWQLGNIITGVVVVLAAGIVYWVLVRGGELRPTAVSAEAYDELPQPVIQRTLDLLKTITRGTILDRNGRQLAFDQEIAAAERVRIYTEPSLAHVLGYVSGIRVGIAGLELTYNDSLLGIDRPDAAFGQATHQPIQGSDLVLTIDSHLQRVAETSLAGKAGAVVVLDGKTGAILALVSEPHFDPNQVLDPAYMESLLNGCPDTPTCQGALINRATQGAYTPGSTFKTLTLIAALDTGQATPETIFDFGTPVSGPDGSYYVYEVGGGVIPDPNHTEAQLSLEMSYAKSANAAFARIGDEMPAEVLIEYAARFGFSVPSNNLPPLEIPLVPPQLAHDVNVLFEDDWLRASTAIGQGELLANPLTMARLVLAVVNRGSLPEPFLVQAIRDPQGNLLRQQPASVITSNLMKPETADLVRRLMITTVEQGSGRRALVEGAVVGGKTGTAQVGGNLLPHAWFIGFAESNDRTVVIAVIVENGGEGSAVAAPIFAQVADAALRHLGEGVTEVVAIPTATGPTGPASPPVPEIPRDPDKLEVITGSGACPGQYTGPMGSGLFTWPVDVPFRQVVGGDFILIHPGVDLGAPPGAPIYAADAGVVVFANWSDIGYGNTVVIDHGNGFQTLYAHLSQVGTSCGIQVAAGDVIGNAGATGKVFGPHLHFELRVPGGFVNPWKYLPPP